MYASAIQGQRDFSADPSDPKPPEKLTDMIFLKEERGGSMGR